MDDFDDEIPELEFECNFSIIYKGKEEQDSKIEPIKEFKTSKDDFFRKLRYFKKKAHEFDLINEIFIHEDCPVEIFGLFIDSIKTNKIRLTENNYLSLSKLSSKYEYYELQRKIELFSQKRPDIKNIIENYSFDDIDFIKEEMLSKHLDICLQNEKMINFPIPLLNRILNSPKRVINDHHLLFQFVKKVVNKNANNNDNGTDTEEKLQVLFSSLDYIQMSSDELEELFNNEHFSCVLNCRNSKEQMKNLIEERKFNKNRMKDLEIKMDDLQNNVLKEIEKFKLITNEMEKKLNDQNKTISDNNDYQNRLVNEIEEIKRKNSASDNKIIEMEQIILNNKTEIQNLKDQIKEFEQKVNREIKGNIDISVQSDQSIKGVIKLKEVNTKIDLQKSKYLLNKSNSHELGSEAYSDGCTIESLSQEVCFFKPAGTYFLHAFVIDKYGTSKEFVSEALHTNGVFFKFDFTGSVQYATLEPGTYKLEVWGAEGGKHNDWNKTAGKGGYSSGLLKLTKKTKLFVHVGQSPTTKYGGWNGGGESINNSYAVGGGGATDISLQGANDKNWNNKEHLYSRIIVAGGGGGSSHNSHTEFYGGYGGGESGQSTGTTSGLEGKQTQAGDSNNSSSGQGFGIGGSHTQGCSSGGGGGWYGGSSSVANNDRFAGGSGGSGYVYSKSTASYYPSGCLLNSSFYLTNASTIDGGSSFPNPQGSGNETGHCGNGYAKITPL